MNDLLNDIKKLENLKNLLWEKDISSKDFSRNKISTYIQEMIKEKLDIVSDFEKQNMSYADYEEHMKGVGLDDVA
jgi:tRNA G10  N-methylase Trm11